MKQTWLMMIITIIVILTGCATTPEWQTVTAPLYVNSKLGYTVNLPDGWIEIPNRDASVLTLSRNGVPLNVIIISGSDGTKAFPATKKEACLSSNIMLPSDLAADFIAEAKIRQRTDNLQVLKNEPATINGKDGFHLEVQFLTQDGLTYDLEAYGVCNSKKFYMIFYRAPKIYYFDQDLPTFNSVLASFKFTDMSDR